MLEVLPECYVDTNLIEFLLDAGVNHQHSCSQVVGQLNSTFADRFAVGIIDKDKVELGYISDCEQISKTKHLTLLRHKTRPQYLITVSPAIDSFVLDCANQEGVDTQTYGIPSDLAGFTKMSKSRTSNRDPRFRNLFASIRDNDEIKALRTTLRYMCESKYDVDVKQLRQMFEDSSTDATHISRSS